MSYYVYSTATCSGSYCVYEENSPNDIAVLKHWPDGEPMKVTIQGGHGVSDKHFFTPKGVCTKVSDREMDLLLNNKPFLRHVEKGFMSYDKKKIAPEKKARDMADKDKSAPLTPSDFAKGQNSDGNTTTYARKEAA